MTMQEIDFIAERVATIAVEKAMVNRQCEHHDERLREVEKKVFNGFGTSIKWLKLLAVGAFVSIGALASLHFF